MRPYYSGEKGNSISSPTQDKTQFMIIKVIINFHYLFLGFSLLCNLYL